MFKDTDIPFITVFNKADLLGETDRDTAGSEAENTMYVSALTNEGIDDLKERIASMRPADEGKRLIADKINAGDMILLVVPIDKAAPKGRLILPQQQTIRDILDAGASAVVVRDSELAAALEKLGECRPALVITDSQVFGKVDEILPEDIPLTSFSILMANYKGELNQLMEGVKTLSALKDGDKVLISEGCTHHRQCEDIGTVKMPCWILEHSKKDVKFEFTSGSEFPEDLTRYRLIIHCGGCMLNEAEMKHRIDHAKKAGIPIVNYGIAIAGMHGIPPRSLELFPDMLSILK
jgi:[FeFe] hydrogenase H-cluster maturation GTPase HydF